MKNLAFILLVVFTFTSISGFASNSPIFLLAQQAVQEVLPAPLQQNPDESKFSYDKALKENREVTILFTIDEENKIHVLHVSGGINLVTQYIKNSLEGKEIHSENAIPGINYVMTVKLPASV